jgi:hypothetical protein
MVMNKLTTRLMAGMLSAAFAISIGSAVSGADPGANTDESTTTTTSTVVETTIDTSTTTTTTTTVPRVKPRVLLVGDSTMAAMRWFTDGRKSLSGSTFIVDVESCRSIGGYSCYGREYRAPSTAYEVVESVKGRLDVVVLMAGTHHNPATVESDLRSFRRIVAKKGAKLVVLTLRDLNRPTATIGGVTLIERVNEMIERLFQTPKYETTYIANWKAFSRGHDDWFRSDGIHLTIRGTLALGWFISNVVAHVAEVPCTSYETEVCPKPKWKDSHVNWLRRYRVQYTETHCYEDGGMRRKVCVRDRRLG